MGRHDTGHDACYLPSNRMPAKLKKIHLFFKSPDQMLYSVQTSHPNQNMKQGFWYSLLNILSVTSGRKPPRFTRNDLKAQHAAYAIWYTLILPSRGRSLNFWIEASRADSRSERGGTVRPSYRIERLLYHMRYAA